MTSVNRQLDSSAFEWKVTQLPECDIYYASEYFYFQKRRWDLRFVRFDKCCILYFNSDNNFNPPIKIKLDVTFCNESCEMPIMAENHKIWSMSNKNGIHLKAPLIFRVIIQVDSSRLNEMKTTSAIGTSQEKISSRLGGSIHFDALSRDISKLLEDDTSFDVTITCEGKTFHAHKIILQTRSSVFSAMLISEMVEGKTGLISLKDIKLLIFEKFLRYVYSGVLPELNADTAKEFYKVGDQYAVDELKSECSRFMINNLSERNALETLVFSDLHSDEDFRRKVIAFIIEKEIPKHHNWSDFCKCNGSLAMEVLNEYVKKH